MAPASDASSVAQASLTPNDQAVLAVLSAANGPVTAYDILARLRPERPKLAPPTVYRALAHLLAAGLARRVESLNAWLPSHGEARVVFAICDDCGRVEEHQAEAALDSLTHALEGSGFHPRRPMIEVHGLCGACDGVGDGGAVA